ncbi:MAG: Exoribonuclease 2, partial [Pseudomonadota bacterium]
TVDAMALDVSGTVLEKIIADNSETQNAEAGLDEAMEDLDEAASGPIAIAMNINEAPAED